MIPLVLSLTLGLATLLIFDGLTGPRRDPAPPRWEGRLTAFLRRAGVREVVTPRDFLLFSAGSGLVSGVAAHLVLGWPVVSAIAAALGLVAPTIYYTRRHTRRRAAVQAALVDAIAQLRDGIRAGLSVQEAFAGLARSGPEPLRPEFAALVRDLRFRGLAAALGALRERLADPLVDTVVAALLLNDRLGGRNVSQVLDQLARATRAESLVQEELRAYQARTVLSARIVAAIPLVVLVLIRRVNPSYLAVFEDLTGQVLLAGCLVSVAVGYAAMVRLTHLPGNERVLGS